MLFTLLRGRILRDPDTILVGKKIDENLLILGTGTIDQFCTPPYLTAEVVSSKTFKLLVPVKTHVGIVLYVEQLFGSLFVETVEHLLFGLKMSATNVLYLSIMQPPLM